MPPVTPACRVICCDGEAALFVPGVGCRASHFPASPCPPVGCSGSSKCSRSEQAGCVPVVVAYRGTIAAPQASPRFTYCSVLSAPLREETALILPDSLSSSSALLSAPDLLLSLCLGSVLSPHTSLLSAWACTCLVDTFVKPLTLWQ